MQHRETLSEQNKRVTSLKILPLDQYRKMFSNQHNYPSRSCNPLKRNKAYILINRNAIESLRIRSNPPKLWFIDVRQSGSIPTVA